METSQEAPATVPATTVGRIVIYVPVPGSPQAHNGAVELPAVVVRVWKVEKEKNFLNLKVFTDGPTDFWMQTVPYSAENQPGTWHWPMRN